MVSGRDRGVMSNPRRRTLDARKWMNSYPLINGVEKQTQDWDQNHRKAYRGDAAQDYIHQEDEDTAEQETSYSNPSTSHDENWIWVQDNAADPASK